MAFAGIKSILQVFYAELINKIMHFKYATHHNKPAKRRKSPERWVTGPNILEHEMYYAWSKHRSQAHYRGEQYDLTWEDWCQLWTLQDFARRGRGRNDLTLTKIDPDLPWSLSNAQVMTRYDSIIHIKTYVRSV